MRVVGGFDVAAGEQPAIQAAVMDEEDAIAVGREDEAAGGDVAGSELVAGEGMGGAVEQEEDEFEAFESLPVGGIVEGAGDGGDSLGIEHEMKKPPGMTGRLDYKPGDVLLSHTLARAVPSGLRSLTTVFGMGTGGSSSLRSPRNW